MLCREEKHVFCKKPGHMKKECRKYKDWKENNSVKKSGSNSWQTISCYNCGKKGHISRECRSERENNGRRDDGCSGSVKITEMAKSLAALQEVLKKLSPDTVFPYRVSTADGLKLQKWKKIIM